MSCTKQLPGTRSFSIVQSDADAPVIRHDQRNQTSPQVIPAMVLRLTLEALTRFIGDVTCIVADALIAALSWLISEFLAGCATYAETMHPMAITMDDRDPSLNHAAPAPDDVSPTPAATRLRLVVVAGSAQDDPRPHDQLPARQAAASGRLTLRDWTSLQDIETTSSGRVPAARRKNRPR
jgi:hypothetical protein